MTNAKRLSSGASFLDSLTRLASRLRYYLPFRSNAMAESYKPLFEDTRFNGGRSSADAVEQFELLAGGLLEGNDRLVDLVPTYIEIRKELKHPWHEYILAEVTLRNPTAGTQRPLGLLTMERSFLDYHHANDPDKPDASSDPPRTAAEPAPANAGGSTTTTAPPRATSVPAAVATTDDRASTHSHPPESATAHTKAAGNNAQKKDSFFKSGSVSNLASESSHQLSHSSQAISTSAYDRIKFLPMSQLKTLNDESLPVLEMRLKNTSPETLAAIPDYAILHLLVLTYEYTKNHLKYTVLNHQCYHYAIHAFRCAQLLFNTKAIYQEKSFTYTGDRSHIRRGYYKLGATFYITNDPGLKNSTVKMLKEETENKVKVQLEVWLKRGNLKGERTKRQEAEAAAEEERKQKEEAKLAAEDAKRAAEDAKRAAEEERKQKEEAKRAAEAAERVAKEAERAAEEAERAAEEERKKREALEEKLARLMAGYAPTQHK